MEESLDEMLFPLSSFLFFSGRNPIRLGSAVCRDPGDDSQAVASDLPIS